jgi:hypothetical protein
MDRRVNGHIERRRPLRRLYIAGAFLVGAILLGTLALVVLALLDRAGIIDRQDALENAQKVQRVELQHQGDLLEQIDDNQQQDLDNRRLLLCIGRSMAGQGGGAQVDYLTRVCLLSVEEAEFIRGERDDLPRDEVED